MSVVTDELLERFAREYYANSPRCPYDPETARTAPMDVAYLRTSEDGVAMAAALAAVAPLIAQAEREKVAATVAALVEALEGMAGAADHENWHLDCVLAKALSDARAALALYRGEAGR